jgi:hypothetical protein
MRSAFYALWGVLTLVLLFTATFLFLRLSQTESGYETTSKPSQGETGLRDDSAKTERPLVRLYFAHPTQLRLVAEDRPFSLTAETRENCRAAIRAMTEGPSAGASPVLPPATRVRAIYLLDSGELIVDFTRDIDAPALHSAGAEWLVAQALAHTLTQPGIQGAADRPVTSVRLLYEGSPAEEGFPGHISLPGPIRPDPRLVGE